MILTLALLLAATPWPGESFTQAVDLTPLEPGTAAGFGQQLSDLHWNPLTRTLWIARAPSGVWALQEASDGGFRIAARYPAINSDYEGITQARLDEAAVFVLDETGGFIRKYSVEADGGSALLRAWNLAGVVGAQVGNAGPEGLAFVPDESLQAAGFPRSALDGGGLFFVAHQNGGYIYVVDLDPVDPTIRVLIARLTTSRLESSALAFDRSSGRLYVSHNTGTNFLEVDRLALLPDAGLGLTMVAEIESPSGSNLEGFAVTPQYSSDGGAPAERWCFWADDDGNSVGRPGLMWFRQLPAVLSIAAGNGQAAPALSAVPVAPAVMLRDSFSNPYVGQRVTFLATAGNGTVNAASAITTSAGLGVVGAWILGAAGTQLLTASAPDVSPASSVVFTATIAGAGGSGGGGVAGGVGGGGTGGTGVGTRADAGEIPIDVPRGCGCDTTPAAWAFLSLWILARLTRAAAPRRQ